MADETRAGDGHRRDVGNSNGSGNRENAGEQLPMIVTMLVGVPVYLVHSRIWSYFRR